MQMQINSRKLGKTLYFRIASRGGYLWVSVGDSEWMQCCAGGGMMGSTIDCSPSNFEKGVRNWYRQYVANS